MTDADNERLVKHVFRSYLKPNGDHVYVTKDLMQVIIQSAIDLGIVELKDHPYVQPYSGLENLS